MNVNSKAFAKPKLTKKQRKRINGMNAATALAFKEGHKPPLYRNTSPVGQPVVFEKVALGVPYVNPENFGL